MSKFANFLDFSSLAGVHFVTAYFGQNREADKIYDQFLALLLRDVNAFADTKASPQRVLAMNSGVFLTHNHLSVNARQQQNGCRLHMWFKKKPQYPAPCPMV